MEALDFFLGVVTGFCVYDVARYFARRREVARQRYLERRRRIASEPPRPHAIITRDRDPDAPKVHLTRIRVQKKVRRKF